MTYVYDPQNIFAKILRGEVPSKKVYEDAFSLVFEDRFPQAPVHLLVIPKGAYVGFSHFIKEASPAEIEGFFKAIQTAAEIIDVEKSGYRLISNNGTDSGQEVPHLHFHLLGKKKISSPLA